ncbi:MAG TPA: YggT family protein [Spirochaetota bacterium]|nr:YggT family protein [Spirochaetota bacterium]HOL57012.1 YggT family protein [Spirochaetota bacterium]HPP04059.1 YggT family protein [Spirochaetota bacterium]
MALIGSFLITILNTISLILTIRIILSWLVLPPLKIVYWLNKITDPIFNFFRKRFPFLRLGFLDLSIIVPFLLIHILNKIIFDLMINHRIISLFYIFDILFFIVESIISIFLTVLFIFTIVLFFVNIFAPYTYNPFVTSMRSVIDPVAIRISKLLKINSRYADRIYLIIIALLILIAGFVIFFLLGILKFLLSKIIP